MKWMAILVPVKVHGHGNLLALSRSRGLHARARRFDRWTVGRNVTAANQGRQPVLSNCSYADQED
jgi:hypothetical protein